MACKGLGHRDRQASVRPQSDRFDVHAAIFSHDGTRIFTASEYAAPTIWNAQDGTKIAKLPGADWVHPTVLAVSPDGQNDCYRSRK